MVDALVAASQAAYVNPNGGQPMPGYGRDLVPFFDDDGNEAEGRVTRPPRGPQPRRRPGVSTRRSCLRQRPCSRCAAPTYVQQVPNPQLAAAAKPPRRLRAPQGFPRDNERRDPVQQLAGARCPSRARFRAREGPRRARG